MRLTETELYLFNNGVNCYAYRTLGCHAVNAGEQAKFYRFSVYAPNAKRVSVVGDFNGWDTESLRMTPCGSTGGTDTKDGLSQSSKHIYDSLDGAK